VRLSQAFISRDEEFFELLEQAGWSIQYAAELLAPMLSGRGGGELAGEVGVYANNGRRVTHDLFVRLNQTYVTAIDRRDMLRLAQALDDTIDMTEGVAEFITLYRIDAPTEHAQQLADVLVRCARKVAAAIPRTSGMKDVSEHVAELKRLEHEGDRIMRQAIAALFAEQTDPIAVLRWKDIYARLDGAIHAMRRVANILETIVVKNI
jgi:uncharacterized protein Yka (UPF0111/DUF47 family)